MAKIAEERADKVTVTADNSRCENVNSIISDILCGFSSAERVTVIPKREEAIYSAILEANESDIVVICGKGAEKYNIDESGYHPFDDSEVARAAITQRRSQ